MLNFPHFKIGKIMNYISREMSELAILKMKDFHERLKSLYSDFGINVLEDICRRNALMSHAQEKFFAEEICKGFPGAFSDGRTGCADIVIPSINKELECKLTTKKKAGGFSLQSDIRSLSDGSSLDFLYVLSNREFDKFAVLHFIGLNRSDFLALSPGSRGKVKMNKSIAMKKCKVLLGNVSVQNDIELEKISVLIEKEISERTEKILMIESRIKNAPTRAKKNSLFAWHKREKQYLNNKISTLEKRKEFWKNSQSRFSIELE